MPEKPRNHLYETVQAKARAVFIALDERDSSTYAHSTRVAGLSQALGRACNLSAQELSLLLIAAGFHDIGKIGIPDSVLKKTTPLTEADWVVMKAHSEKSQRILLAADVEGGETVGLAVRHHHERYDGFGYPDGLAGETIPFLARIVSVVDGYDAMGSARVCGPIRPHAEIMKILEDGKGRQHDPYFVDKLGAFIETSPLKFS